LVDLDLLKLKILIRVDGYNKIGLGHIYRAIALAKRLTKHEILFVTKEEHDLGIKLIEKNKLTLKFIRQKEDLWKIISDFRPTIIINDILDTKKDYIEELKKQKIFVVNFEDLGEGSRRADLIINALYEERISIGTHYWGKDYYILRDEFLKLEDKCIKKEIKNILITFGGTDPNNYTKRILNILNELKLNNVKINVILGLGYREPHNLEDFGKNLNLDVTIKQNIKNIGIYMYEADIAFTSAGRTVYELASIGTPTIVLAQNKREKLHVFAKKDNGIINLGLGYNCSDQKIKEVLLRLIDDFDLRKKYQKLMIKNDLKSGINNVLNLIFSSYKKYNEGVLDEEF
jgi:spore coat polysaccharide biosynthesis predicted glycosyltransferase SpsG